MKKILVRYFDKEELGRCSTIIVRLKEDTSVGTLKQKIFERLRIPPENQTLERRAQFPKKNMKSVSFVLLWFRHLLMMRNSVTALRLP